MGVRKRERELLFQLEEKRAQLLDIKARLSVVYRGLYENIPTRDFSDDHIKWMQRRDESLDPLVDERSKREQDFFESFAELVSVRSKLVGDFAWEASRLISDTGNDAYAQRGARHHKQSPALVKAEAALKAALAAVRALPEKDCYAVGTALFLRAHHDKRAREFMREDNGAWVEVLAILANCAATAVGTSSARIQVDDELNVNRENWALLNFIRMLWRLVHKYGGGAVL
jgi:hypothetical protein